MLELTKDRMEENRDILDCVGDFARRLIRSGCR